MSSQNDRLERLEKFVGMKRKLIVYVDESIPDVYNVSGKEMTKDEYTQLAAGYAEDEILMICVQHWPMNDSGELVEPEDEPEPWWNH